MLTLYDAARCPYCARVRIVLAEKDVEYEPIEIDLKDRPAWIYEKNSTGRVPVIEEDGWVLPESAVIMEFLEERYPEPRLLAADPADRALARLTRALRELEIGGCKTTKSLHVALAGDPEVRAATYDTRWLERRLEQNAFRLT